MSETKYYVIPIANDDEGVPTQPDPVPLEELGKHIADWLGRYKQQGLLL